MTTYHTTTNKLRFINTVQQRFVKLGDVAIVWLGLQGSRSKFFKEHNHYDRTNNDMICDYTYCEKGDFLLAIFEVVG